MPEAALYDPIAGIYDPWSASVTEDVEFYVEEALASGGPVVELAVGTGRIAIPIAQAGIPVVGVDLSPGMLDIARAYAAHAGVSELVDLRLGDMREPPIAGRVPLVIIPFRSLLHMENDAERLRVFRAAGDLLEDGGRLIFDVFAPSSEDIAATHGRWLEREPGIFERADWDAATRTLRLSVRGGTAAVSFDLHWLTAPEWDALIAEAGLELVEVYGWFDRRPYAGDEDTVWVCRRSRRCANASIAAA